MASLLSLILDNAIFNLSSKMRSASKPHNIFFSFRRGISDCAIPDPSIRPWPEICQFLLGPYQCQLLAHTHLHTHNLVQLFCEILAFNRETLTQISKQKDKTQASPCVLLMNEHLLDLHDLEHVIRYCFFVNQFTHD